MQPGSNVNKDVLSHVKKQSIQTGDTPTHEKQQHVQEDQLTVLVNVH